MDQKRQVQIIPVALLLVLVAACNNTGYVPVQNAGESRGQVHTVSRGETLYAIAFRYGVDYRELAKANGISAPYTIYVDQKLRVAVGRQIADSGPDTSPKSPGPKPKVVTGKSPARITPPNQPVRPVVNVPGVDDSAIAWRWPHGGTVVNRFGQLNQGIDIAGKFGDSVRASADGVVVYAGSGLRGYGTLVIVKHNDRFLSAYGHNEKILVDEGDSVRGGQVIATLGEQTGKQDLLHFEIRRDGKPEDPLKFLPAQR